MSKIMKLINHPQVVRWNGHMSDWGFIFIPLVLLLLILALNKFGCGFSKQDNLQDSQSNNKPISIKLSCHVSTVKILAKDTEVPTFIWTKCALTNNNRM